MNKSWTLYQALDVIKQLQEINKHGYYIALAGSVLDKGYSENDLDLVMYPAQEIDSKYLPAIEFIISILKVPSFHLQLFPEKKQKLVYFLRLESGQEINVFIPNKSAEMQETEKHFTKTYKAY